MVGAKRTTWVLVAAAVLFATALLISRSSKAAQAEFVQGPGTVPDAVLQEAVASWSWWGPTDQIVIQGATTVKGLWTLEPGNAQVFKNYPPDDPVYVAFIHGQYERHYVGEVGPYDFYTDTGMLLFDKDGTVLLSHFFEPGSVPAITQAFAPEFDRLVAVGQATGVES